MSNKQQPDAFLQWLDGELVRKSTIVSTNESNFIAALKIAREKYLSLGQREPVRQDGGLVDLLKAQEKSVARVADRFPYWEGSRDTFRWLIKHLQGEEIDNFPDDHIPEQPSPSIEIEQKAPTRSPSDGAASFHPDSLLVRGPNDKRHLPDTNVGDTPQSLPDSKIDGCLCLYDIGQHPECAYPNCDRHENDAEPLQLGQQDREISYDEFHENIAGQHVGQGEDKGEVPENAAIKGLEDMIYPILKEWIEVIGKGRGVASGHALAAEKVAVVLYHKMQERTKDLERLLKLCGEHKSNYFKYWKNADTKLSQLQSERQVDAQRIAGLEKERDRYREALDLISDGAPGQLARADRNLLSQTAFDALAEFPQQPKP